MTDHKARTARIIRRFAWLKVCEISWALSRGVAWTSAGAIAGIAVFLAVAGIRWCFELCGWPMVPPERVWGADPPWDIRIVGLFTIGFVNAGLNGAIFGIPLWLATKVPGLFRVAAGWIRGNWAQAVKDVGGEA